MKAVITGASSGIGRAIAKAIASTGSSVCPVGRDTLRLEAVAKDARKTSRTVLVHKTDLSDDAAVEGLAHRISKNLLRSTSWFIAPAPMGAELWKIRLFNNWTSSTGQTSGCHFC
jgi:short-subunit dehydrogenase